MDNSLKFKWLCMYCVSITNCNERIKKIYAAQGDKISMSQIKRILGDRPCIEDERLVLEKGIWRKFGA